MCVYNARRVGGSPPPAHPATTNGNPSTWLKRSIVQTQRAGICENHVSRTRVAYPHIQLLDFNVAELQARLRKLTDSVPRWQGDTVATHFFAVPLVSCLPA